jgi:hypothetical protein
MPTMKTGLFTTQNIQTELHERQIAREVFLREANIAPIHAMMQAFATEKATQFKVEWAEDQIVPWTDAIDKTAGYADTDLTFTVDNASYFNVDDYVKNLRTGEIMGPVTSVTSTDIVVGNRQAGETAKAAILDDDPLLILRGNIKEGGDAAEAINTIPTMEYNYLERWSHTVKVSETLDNVNLYTGSERTRLREKKFIEHRETIEHAIIDGERGIDNTSATGPRLLMRGVVKRITTNITSISVGAGGTKTFSEEQWNDWLRTVYNYGGVNKVVFASGEVLARIAQFGRNTLQTRPADKTLGMAVTSYMTPFGDVSLVHHRFLSSTYGKDWWAICLDLSRVDFMPLIPTRIKPNIQGTKAHSIEDEYYTEATLRMPTETAHGLFTG